MLEERFEARPCDGFVIAATHVPGAYADFVQHVVPELQRRGLYHTDYAGKTLRENLGLPRPILLFDRCPTRKPCWHAHASWCPSCASVRQPVRLRVGFWKRRMRSSSRLASIASCSRAASAASSSACPRSARVMMEIARGCPSSGWVLALTGGHAIMFSAFFPEQAQIEIYGDSGEFRAPSSTRANVPGQPVEGGYMVSGAWDYASGIDVSTHFIGGINVPNADGSGTEPRMMILDRADYSIVDNWHVIGMQGTGSRRVIASDVFVPDVSHHRAATRRLQRAQRPGSNGAREPGVRRRSADQCPAGRDGGRRGRDGAGRAGRVRPGAVFAADEAIRRFNLAARCPSTSATSARRGR